MGSAIFLQGGLRTNPRTAGAVVGLAAIGVYVFSLAWAMEHSSYDVWGGMLAFPVLVMVSLPVILRVCRDDQTPPIGLLSAAVVAKLLGGVARYYVVLGVYGKGDALAYDRDGRAIADAFRAGSKTLVEVIPRSQGTEFISELTGFVYSFIGPSRLAGFLVFSWLGYWGLFLLYRAALIGLPEANHRRYALLLFFLPSMLFWPSSIGKESWIMLGIGVTFYGGARLLAGLPGGLTLAAVGAVMAGYVRPHITAICVVALSVAVVFRRSTGRTSALSPLKRLAVLGVLVVGSSVAISQTTRFLPDDTGSGLSGILATATARTAEGGSQVDAERPNSPFEYPSAFVSVMFRPTLAEVRNGTSAIAALETTFVAALCLVGWRRFGRSIPMLFRRPYLLFCLTYAGIFAFAWSSIGNLGILARQRTLAWPFLLVLVAVRVAPSPSARTDRSELNTA